MLSDNLKSKFITTLPIVIIVAFYIPIYLVLFSNSNVLALTDIIMPQAGAKQNLDFFLSIWHPQYFGGPGPTPITTLLASGILSVDNNLAFCQRFIAFLPLFLSTMCMYIFLLKSKLVKSPWVRTAASMLYGVNFLTLSGLSATSLMYTYAFMPLIILFAFLLISKEKNTWFNVLGLSLSMLLASFINIQASVDAAFIVIPLFITLFVARVSKKQGALRYVGRVFLALFAFVGFYVLLTLPFSSTWQSFINIAFSKFNVTGGGISVKSFFLDSSWYRQTFPSIVSPLLSLTSPVPATLTDYLGFLIPVTILVPLFSKDRLKKLVAFPLIVTIIICAAIVWVVSNNGPLGTTLYYKFFFLQAFIEPAKWYFVVVPCLCILLAMGMDELLRHVRLPSLRKIKVVSMRSWVKGDTLKSAIVLALITIVCLSIILSDNFTVINLGDVVAPQNIFSSQGGPHYEPNYVPSYLIQLGNMFNGLRETSNFRVLWLPTDNYVENALSIVDPADNLFPPLNESGFLFNYMCNIVNEMHNGNATNLAQQLGALSIRYVVVLKTINQTVPISVSYYGSTPQFIFGNPDNFIQVLNNQSALQVVSDTADFTVYKNTDFIPMITVNMVKPVNLNETSFGYYSSQGTSDAVSEKIVDMTPYYCPSEYTIQINASQPFSLVLSQNYNPSWQAYVIDPNGKQQVVSNFEAFGWANGFYIDTTGSYVVKIVFNQQTTYNSTIMVWSASCLLLFSLFLFLGFQKRLRLSLKRSTHINRFKK